MHALSRALYVGIRNSLITLLGALLLLVALSDIKATTLMLLAFIGAIAPLLYIAVHAFFERRDAIRRGDHNSILKLALRLPEQTSKIVPYGLPFGLSVIFYEAYSALTTGTFDAIFVGNGRGRVPACIDHVLAIAFKCCGDSNVTEHHCQHGE